MNKTIQRLKTYAIALHAGHVALPQPQEYICQNDDIMTPEYNWFK